MNIDGSKVINSSSIPVTVRVVLKQFIRLATTGRFHCGTEGIQRFEIGEKSIQAGSTGTLDGLTLIIPPVPPSFFGAQGSFCAQREPLIFSYALSLQAKAKSACPYSKLEVLRVMAPYCSDPENKEKLLDHLYKFEREEASKYFRS